MAILRYACGDSAPRADEKKEVRLSANHPGKTALNTHEALSQIREHWLSHIVHDVRGPLFAARGYAKLLLDDRAGELTVTQRRYVTVILENANKLTASMDEFRQVPSFDDLALEMVDLAAILHSAIDVHQSPDKTLHVERRGNPGAILTVGDRAKLTLAVHKLLGVTVEFSRSPGKIDLYVNREDGEFVMRIAVSPAPAETGSNLSAPPDLAIPSQILRLHGGLLSADFGHTGIFNVTSRLPLIVPAGMELG